MGNLANPAGIAGLTVLALAGIPALVGASTVVPVDSGYVAKVESFVSPHDIYDEGVEYENAHALGHAALPILSGLLRDPAYTISQATIVSTIAFVDAPGGLDTLRSFLWDRFEHEVDVETFRALIETPPMMGMLSDPRAVDVLEPGVNPDYWKGVRWWHGANKDGQLGILLSKATINGVSFSGSRRAGKILRALKEAPYSAWQVSNIDEGIKRQAEIAKVGLAHWISAQRASQERP